MQRQFMAGMATTIGVTMAIQDWYGLEGYVQHVQEHWVDLHWSVGVGVAFVSAWFGAHKPPTERGTNV